MHRSFQRRIGRIEDRRGIDKYSHLSDEELVVRLCELSQAILPMELKHISDERLASLIATAKEAIRQSGNLAEVDQFQMVGVEALPRESVRGS